MLSAARNIVVDLDSPGGYNGLGDVVTFAWLAASARKHGVSISFKTGSTPKRLLLVLLNQREAESGGAPLATGPLYAEELAQRGREPRLQFLKRSFGIGTAPDVRPDFFLPPESEQWAEETYRKERGAKRALVMLFPAASFVSRQYPWNAWCDVAWSLHDSGVACVVFDQGYSEAFPKFPRWYYGVDLANLAALIKRADLVVGNDSFPIHLAGTLDTAALALLGPTNVGVFQHVPRVKTLAADEVACTGCYFAHPFRSACDLGCRSLFQLSPDEVVRSVEARLNKLQFV